MPKGELFAIANYAIKQGEALPDDWQSITPTKVQDLYEGVAPYILENQTRHKGAIDASVHVQQIEALDATSRRRYLVKLAGKNLSLGDIRLVYSTLLNYKKLFCRICLEEKLIAQDGSQNFIPNLEAKKVSFDNICKECSSEIDTFALNSVDRRTCMIAFTSQEDVRGWNKTILDAGYEKDHVFPLSLGGPHALGNQQALTRAENNEKGNKLRLKDIALAIFREEMGKIKVPKHQHVLWGRLKSAFHNDELHTNPELVKELGRQFYTHNEYFYNSLNFLYRKSKSDHSKRILGEYLKYAKMEPSGLKYLSASNSNRVDEQTLSRITTLEGLIKHFEEKALSYE